MKLSTRMNGSFFQNKKKGRLSKTNSYDCGMFVIACIDSLVNNLPIEESSYSQANMPEFRLKLVKSISQGSLHKN